MKTTIADAVAMAAKLNPDPIFAAGFEAGEVGRLLLEKDRTGLGHDEEGMVMLRSMNREVYRSFAKQFQYSYVIMTDLKPDVDAWRFIKKED